MKLNFNTLKTVYLYEDGHAVLVHEKSDKDAGKVSWVEIVEKFGPRCDFTGRVYFSSIYSFNPGIIGLVQKAESVTANKARVESGSQNTKEMGIAVGSLDVKGKGWNIHQISFPNLISSDWTYQPDTVETWEDIKDKYSWAGHNIAKKHCASSEAE